MGVMVLPADGPPAGRSAAPELTCVVCGGKFAGGESALFCSVRCWLIRWVAW